ncbi:MAG: 3-coathanger stack domain-containing protein [Bacteroidia bacterium]
MKNLNFLVGCFMLILFLQAEAQQPEHLPDYKTNPVHFNTYVSQYQDWLKSKKERAETPAEKRLVERKSKHFYRWFWLNKDRLDVNGYTVNTQWKAIEANQNVNSAIANARALPGGDWVNLGPTQVNSLIPSAQQGIGRVDCIAFNNASSEVFVGTAAGGLWKRPASGGTWSCITNSIPNLSVSSISINPSNPLEILLLTGDAHGADNPSIGLLKTNDGGLSWNQTGLKWQRDSLVRCYKVLRNPFALQTIYVASSVGLLKSTDGGSTWINAQVGFFIDVEIKPGSSSTLYASTNNAFYISTNTGTLWTQVTIPGLANSGADRCELAVSPASSSTVYFAAGKNALPGFIGLWKSTSSGSAGSWNLISSAATTSDVFIDGSASYSQASYDFAFAVNPSNINEVFIGGIDTYRSINGGVSFNRESSYYQLGNDNMHADQHAFEYDGAGNMWVGNDAGVFRYTPSNPTSKWTAEYNGLAITQYYGIGLDRDPNIFGNYEANYLGAQDNGQHRYDGDANNQIVYFGDGGDAVVDYTNDNTYYWNGNAKLFKNCAPAPPCDKTPPVTTCNCLDTNYNLNGVTPNRPLVIDPSDHNIIYHGLFCLWRSLNGGDTWSLYPGFNCSVGGFSTALEVGVGYKWISKSRAVFRETSPGVWLNVTSNLGPILTTNNLDITDIAVNPSNPLEAWVSMSGYSAANKVFYTTNGGTNWLNWGVDIPNVPVLCLKYQNGTNGGLYAGTDLGIYYTNNVLPNFVPFTNGMPSVIVTDLDINPGQGLLYATTYGRGLWATNLAGSCPADENTNLFASLPGTSSIQASNSIVSSQSFSSGYGQSLELKAGNFVQLNPGFESMNGTVLTARIAACNTVARPVIHYNDGVLVLSTKELSAGINVEPVRNKSESFKMLLHPNPASDLLQVQLENMAESRMEIHITDLSGRLVLRMKTDDVMDSGVYRIPVDVSAFPAGTYIVKTISDGTTIAKPFVKL